MTFKSEADFEEALIRVLQQNAYKISNRAGSDSELGRYSL